MAELLSVSASIVALLQLSEKIISYIDGIKDAKSDIIRIRTALGDLPAVLKKLREISNEKKPPPMLYECAPSLPACEKSMKWILENLEKSRRNPLLWPLREKDVTKRLGDITHAKTTLILALGVDVMYALNQTSSPKPSDMQ